ncbi:molecular chaperone [Desulfosporosinus sp.]|uniref:TorD/DmsD family molecular chaperone n=1 Tax=Desulfosporosinus sp. TaxID=157907 RepID=UPI000E9025FD|nr:molecular chaperone TorD family protein [Desulfosporosinus sp.]MBC2721439.1 molecular chaperone TorD family protein [Desulfosporosinus sp.]MBC2727495.1 molecular chaperone TorD family protein [Desulfosporosinus sp.]HBV87725.1 dehydrogenase [Desulfosporosinus sp.]
MTFFEDCPPQVLKTHGELLLALSHLFAQGGENLSQTLSPLVKSCSAIAEHYNTSRLLQANQILAQYSETNDGEYLVMCYEFNRLFVGPNAPVAPPYESVYLSSDHLVMGEQTLAVRKFYQRENLQTIGQRHEPDDFISTELEFVAYLLSRIIETQAAKNSAKIQLYKTLYQEFWQQHLGLWLKTFAHTVSQSAKHPLFSALSEILVALSTLNAPLNTKEAPYETYAPQISRRSSSRCCL